MDEIEAVLREHAVTDDAQVELTWEIERNVYVTVVKAHTREVFEDRDSAFTAASELVENVLDAGYRLKNRAEISAVASEGVNAWRGKIDIVLEQVLVERL